MYKIISLNKKTHPSLAIPVNKDNYFQIKYPHLIASIIYKFYIMRCETKIFIAISGARNSSKSTTAVAIKKLLEDQCRLTVNLLSMDNYILPEDNLMKMGINPQTQAKDPYGIDFTTAYQHLQALKDNKDVVFTSRDRFKQNYKGKIVRLNPLANITIVEGLSTTLPNIENIYPSIRHSFATKISETFDLHLFLKIKIHSAMKTLLNDAIKKRALGLWTPSDEQIKDRFVKTDIPRFTGHYAYAEKYSDIIFDLDYQNSNYLLRKMTIPQHLVPILGYNNE